MNRAITDLELLNKRIDSLLDKDHRSLQESIKYSALCAKRQRLILCINAMAS